MTEYVTPNIHTVLKKYQTSAPKSLQGPGHSLHTSSNSSNGNASTATAASAATNNQTNNQTSSVQAAVQQLNANCPCPLDVSLNNNGSSASSGSVATSLVSDIHGGLVAMRNSPCDLINKTAAHCTAANAGNSSSIINPANATSTQQHQPSSSNLSVASNCVAGVNINPALPLIKKEIMSSPEPPTAPQTNAASNSVGHHLSANTNTNTNTNSHDLPVDTNPTNILPPQPPSIKIMPPPPPEVSQPILSAADSGSGELFETRLEGKTIGCFSLGGEMRLCLPQFLNNVLAEFSLEQINRSFDDLGIFCSQCTPDQLMEFKAAKILPSDVKSSGLITRTDAERLCAILLHRSDRNSYINVEDIPKGAISFKVYHRCFGKCEGICTPDMYSYQKPTCIMCLECKGWFSPQKFVGHVHREVENRTCHWGFDSRNWHDYLHVALDVENREKYQKILDELKEVEIKEQLKAQHEINYLKRKAEMHMDHSILVPSMGLGPPPPPHQALPPSVVKHRGEQLDIPTSKKAKSLDEPSQYQLDLQHYQLMYAHCAQQRMAAAGQMSAFRPWPHNKTFMHAAYNAAAVAALSTLPYLSQEPPVLQNPERVVRSTDRERFERTYQPNVALAPRKTHLTQEREKEQRELRERERIEREREREIERIRERERSREREREREFEREREREIREREIQKKLQQHQQQQIKQQPVTGMCEGEIQIKQERAPTPCEMSSTPPPLSNHSDEDRRSCNGPLMESDDPTTPLVSPLALSRNKNLPSTHLNHMEMQTRRLSLQNCNSSAASTASSSSSSATSTTPTNLTSANTSPQLPQPLIPAQKLQPQLHHHHAHTHPHHHHHPPPAPLPPQQPAPHHLQRIPIHHGTSGHGHGPQAYIRQSPSPHATHCNSATCQNSRSPEEFGGSNEITSSTSPLPQQHQQQQQQQQQHNAQTIIATVNQHNKLLPSCGSSYGANSSSGSSNSNSNSSSSSGQQQQQHHQQHNNNEMTGRIRISKNLINQSNIMRTPTPPPPPASHPLNHQHLPHNHHQHPQVGLQSQQSVTTAAQSHHQQQQQQQQYDYFKQTQRYYQQQQQQQHQQHQQRNHTPQPQATNLNNHHHQQQQQLHSPSQSSSATNTPTGLNLTTNLSAASNAAATSGSSINIAATTSAVNLQNHDKPHTHLRTPQAFMNQHPHPHPHPHHLPNGRGAMNSEFELSTDTDDESVNDGEADSSNTLAPWELAIETLRDSRPKERERLLNMLQRILNENQHYRLQNQQLKELIEVRNEQIAKLQAELQHCQRQLETLQISPMPAAAASLSNVSLGNINGNGLITKALRKECDDHMMLRVPLKKSQRREPEMYEQNFREKTQKESDEERTQRQCEERIQYNLTQIKRELSESMDEDEGEEEGGRLLDENSQPNVESSTQCEQALLSRRRHLTNNDAATSESEAEDEDDGDDQRMSSTQNQNRSHNDSGDNNNDDDDEVDEEKLKTKNQKDTSDTNPPMAGESEHESHTKTVGYGNGDGDGDEDDDEADEDEVDNDNDDVDDDEDEEDDDDNELHNNHKRVQAPHTNALSTPPTATTPLSPDSAATAGQLFDSSNSSDESSMKKAQMSASHALAKMNSETNDGEDDDDDGDGDDDNDNDEDLNNRRNSNNNNINNEGRRRRRHQQQQEDQLSVNGQSDNEDTQSQSGHSNNDNSETEEEQKQEHIHKSTRHFRVNNKVTSSATATAAAVAATGGAVTASGRSISSIDNINTSINQTTTPPNTTTVVLATKASKKLTPTTNNDIKIKQEYL